MDVLIVKMIALVVMLFLTFIAGIIPLHLVQILRNYSSKSFSAQSRANLILSLLSCFAGGVFLGTTLLHLLPEVNESVEAMLEQASIDTSFPVANFIVALGFFLVMLLEHLVMALQHHWGDISLESSLTLGDRCDSEEREALVKVSSNTYGTTDHPEAPSEPPAHWHAHQDCALAKVEDLDDKCVHVIGPSHHQHHHTDAKQIQGIRSFVLLLALSLHMVFEGLALGLQTSASQVWSLFAAVMIHKAIIAFTLGINFAEQFESKLRVIAFVSAFALMSPLGIGIGAAVSYADGAATTISSAVLQGLATGTFIYVTFFEVLQKEVGQNHSLLKVLTVIIGFGVITLINLFSHD